MNGKKVFFFFVIFFLQLHCLAQEAVFWQLDDEDGLPSNTIYKIVEDKNNLIWIATANGLSYFDGKTVTIFSSEKLISTEVLRLEKSPQGDLWGINLSGQLFYIDEYKNLILINLPTAFQNSKIENFIWHQGELILVLNQNNIKNIAKFDSETNKLSFINEADFTYIYNIVSSGQKIVILGAVRNQANGIWAFDGTSKPKLLIKTAAKLYKDKPILANYLNGFVLLDNENYSLIFFDQNFNVSRKISKKKLPYKNIIINNNRLYVIDDETTYLFNDTDKHLYPILKGKNITNIYTDYQNNIWFGSQNKGVFIVPTITSVFYDKQNSLLNTSEIYSLCVFNKKVFMGSSKGTLYELDSQSGSLISKKIQNIEGRILSIKPINNQKIILCGDGAICIYNTALHRSKVIMDGAYKNVLIEDNNMYMCSAEGIFYGDINKFTYNRNFSIFKKRTYDIVRISKNEMWLGTSEGIYVYDGKLITPLKNSDGFFFDKYRISCMEKDGLGRVWVGTNGRGIQIFNKHDLVKEILYAGYDKIVTCNRIIKNDSLMIMATNAGLICHNIYNLSSYYIKQYDGLPTSEILNLEVDEKKMLWLSTLKGIVCMPLSRLVHTSSVLDHLKIDYININQKKQPLLSKYNLPYNENNIEINITSFDYRFQKKAEYLYRLIGYDTIWRNTSEKTFRYLSLNPGSYTFEIKLKDYQNFGKEEIQSVNFVIAKPFWTTLWFNIMAILVTASIGIFLVRRNQQKRIQQLSFENRLAELKDKAIQAQMNPHFIFNTLNAISHFLVDGDSRTAISYLSLFAKLIRMIFEQSNKRLITVEQEIELLTLYLKLEKLRFGNKVEVELIVDNEVQQSFFDYEILPLILQPVVENSFKHGLFHKKDNGKISISFKVIQHTHLHCIVEDNGVGRQYTMNQRKKFNNNLSFGTSTLEERLKIFHKKNTQITHPYWVIDLVDNANNPIGTRTEIIF